MSERTFEVIRNNNDDPLWESIVHIRFSEDDERYGCLCTFPHNDDQRLDDERVRSLALLGAAVCLASRGDTKDEVYLPFGIPQWILDEIDRVLGISEDTGYLEYEGGFSI